MSRRKIAVTVGILFVVQMVTAMVGTSLIQAFVDGDTDRAPLTTGVVLMLCSGVAVAGIGLLMYPVLKDVSRRLAFWYPVLRVVELAVSAGCGIYLLTQLEVVSNHLLWVYIPTGLGGLVLTYLLFAGRLVPRPIAVLGFVGYLWLTVGVPLDFLGVLDLNAGPGLVLLAPGGLFEFVVLPTWLIAKGFALPVPALEAVSGWRGRGVAGDQGGGELDLDRRAVPVGDSVQ
ncbi:DUF4386 domain-containing protein [Kribbella sp. NPDC026611]|uniref:DUF4386 domain-containing protein n=1 Tax=Kribbella sp. NPDC026611 TaxID=3154911 RepID=UPI0033E8836F